MLSGSLLLDVLLFAALLLAIAALAMAVRLQGRLRAQEQSHRALINVLRNEILAMNSASVGVGKRLTQVEKRLRITAEKQQELENRDPGALAYNQAAKLMEMGASVDELVQTCGIGRPEAELMALLHREVRTGKAIERQR